MPIDATTPTDATLGAALDNSIREDRDQINLLWAALGDVGAGFGYTARALSAGTYAASGIPLEVNAVSAAAPQTLTDITAEQDGFVQLLRFADGNVTVAHDAAKIDLQNSVDFTPAAGDMLVLVSFGGVWHELTRKINV